MPEIRLDRARVAAVVGELVGATHAACANQCSRNYRCRRDSVLSYRQIRSGWATCESAEDARCAGRDPAAAIAGV